MIVQIAPVEKNVGETLASLNFAQRVRTVELGAASKHIENGEAKTNGEVCALIKYGVFTKLLIIWNSSRKYLLITMNSITI